MPLIQAPSTYITYEKSEADLRSTPERHSPFQLKVLQRSLQTGPQSLGQHLFLAHMASQILQQRPALGLQGCGLRHSEYVLAMVYTSLS